MNSTKFSCSIILKWGELHYRQQISEWWMDRKKCGLVYIWLSISSMHTGLVLCARFLHFALFLSYISTIICTMLLCKTIQVSMYIPQGWFPCCSDILLNVNYYIGSCPTDCHLNKPSYWENCMLVLFFFSISLFKYDQSILKILRCYVVKQTRTFTTYHWIVVCVYKFKNIKV